MHAQNMYSIQGRLDGPDKLAMNPVPGTLFTRKCTYKALSGKPHKHNHAKTMKQG